MRTINFGNTQESVPVLWQGTTGTGPKSAIDKARDKARINLLRQGFEQGLTAVDCAELYGGGHAEELLGHAMKGYRDKLFLASKFNPANASSINLVKALEDSLTRLNTDYLDLYQLHWPNPNIPLEETIGALEGLVSSGKIRFIGLSNISSIELQQAIGLSKNIQSVQCELTPIEQYGHHSVAEVCARHGLTQIAFSTLGYTNHMSAALLADIDELANIHGLSRYQLIIAWALQHSNTAVAMKTATPANLQSNIKAAQFEMGKALKLTIDRLLEKPTIEISLAQIIPDASSGHITDLDTAIANPLDLIPYPEELATRIAKFEVIKPLWVKPIGATGNYRLIREHLNYWALVLALGPEAYVPVKLL